MRDFGHKYGNSWRYILQKETERLIYSRLWIPWKKTMKWIDALRMTDIAADFATEACRLRETYLKMQEQF